MSAIAATLSRFVAARPGRSSAFVIVSAAVLEGLGFLVETAALSLLVLVLLTFFVAHADGLTMAHQWENLLAHYVDAPPPRRAPFDRGLVLALGALFVVCAALRQAPRRVVAASVESAVASFRRPSREHHND